MNFAKFVAHVLYRRPPEHEEDIKTYKRRLFLDAFEQFVPGRKEKLVNNQCFESFMGEMYSQIFQDTSSSKFRVISNTLLKEGHTISPNGFVIKPESIIVKAGIQFNGYVTNFTHMKNYKKNNLCLYFKLKLLHF